MLKPLFFTLFSTFIFSSLTAQSSSSPEIIGILPFKVVDRDQIDIAQQLEGQVYEILVGSNRMEIVERQFFSELENEKWRQSQDDFINGEVISKTKSRGARHLMIGQITQSDVSRNSSSNGVSYSCDLKVSVRIIDIETSKIVISATWQNGSLIDFDTGDTKEKAMGNSVNSLKKDIRGFVEDYWPLTGEVIQLDPEGNALVNLGEANGIGKNDRLIVYTSTILDSGQVFTKEVGELKVSEINGPEICTARIRKGKPDIEQALGSGTKLYVKTD
jgi:hypothetical protein